jgi:hypothetical protein
MTGNGTPTSAWNAVNLTTAAANISSTMQNVAGASTAVKVNVTQASSSTTLTCTVFVSGILY